MKEMRVKKRSKEEKKKEEKGRGEGGRGTIRKEKGDTRVGNFIPYHLVPLAVCPK